MFLANVCQYYEFKDEFIRDCMELLKSQAQLFTPDSRYIQLFELFVKYSSCDIYSHDIYSYTYNTYDIRAV